MKARISAQSECCDIQTWVRILSRHSPPRGARKPRMRGQAVGAGQLLSSAGCNELETGLCPASCFHAVQRGPRPVAERVAKSIFFLPQFDSEAAGVVMAASVPARGRGLFIAAYSILFSFMPFEVCAQAPAPAPPPPPRPAFTPTPEMLAIQA